MNNFMIFSPPRTGSSNLIKIMSAHHVDGAKYSFMGEPFHIEGMKKWYDGDLAYTQYAKQRERLVEQHGKNIGDHLRCDIDTRHVRDYIDEVFKLTPAVKHLWSNVCTKNESNEVILKFLKEQGASVIFLGRDNFVLRCVSLKLSQQTGIWSKEAHRNYIGPEPKLTERKAQYLTQQVEPININALHDQIKMDTNLWDRYLSFMKVLGVKHKVSSYESIYAGEEREQREEIKELCEFVEVDYDNLDEKVLSDCLSRKKQKLNPRKSLQRIPNIEEIVSYARKKWGKDMDWILEEE